MASLSKSKTERPYCGLCNAENFCMGQGAWAWSLTVWVSEHALAHDGAMPHALSPMR